MRNSIIKGLFWILLLQFYVFPTFAQQPKDVPAKLSLIINGVPVQGERELMESIESNPSTYINAQNKFNSSIFKTKANESFQLNIQAIYKDGNKSQLTGSPLLKYEHDGCLAVSSQGLVTMTPTQKCTGIPNCPRLTVVLTDGSGHVVGWNRYQFEIQ